MYLWLWPRNKGTVISVETICLHGHRKHSSHKAVWRSCWQHVILLPFDHQGIIHHEYVSLRQTVNKEYYLIILYHLWDAVLCKRPQLEIWKMYHDDSLAYDHKSFTTFWRNSIETFRQLPYSPNWIIAAFGFYKA